MLSRSQYPEIIHGQALLGQGDKTYALPVYASKVSAGYPMAADEAIDQTLHLDRDLIEHPLSTFLVIASGDSMINAGIQSGDILVVDKAIEPLHGRIVVAAVDGELTVKRLNIDREGMQLLPENTSYRPIPITPEQHVVIWGVVTRVIAKS
ncbi:LexA family protein [Legionella feeleii]|uniref:LexA family protein n=1 Tax=Legionella feeleii TaxID=453 RepID=UPI0010417021|nr:translesion error-prone DNA polymerase V autoproteolytic subunit [Legionella feeleii]